jgi:hypothetical protein
MEEPLNNPMSLASFSTMNVTEKTRQSKLETLSFLASSSIRHLSDDRQAQAQAEQEGGGGTPNHKQSDVFKLPPQGNASDFVVVMREEIHASDFHGLVEATVKNEDTVPPSTAEVACLLPTRTAASAGRSSSPGGLVQALVTEVASLKEQYNCLQTEHDDLQMDHDDLKSAHDILEAAHRDLKREYTEFKRDMMQKWLDLASLKSAPPVSNGVVKSGDPVGPASTGTAQTLSEPHALHVHHMPGEVGTGDRAMTHEDAALLAQGSSPPDLETLISQDQW